MGRAPTAGQQQWAELAGELTPAKSLQRLDAATARVVSTVSVVATLLTGFGLVAAGLPNLPDAGQVLAGIAAGLGFLALLAALAAQTLTITKGLNTRNLRAVQDWYRKRFAARAPLTAAAGVLLVLASAAAGIVVLLALTAGPEAPTLAVTRTTDPQGAAAGSAGSGAVEATSTVVAEVTFRDLDDGQVASLTVTVNGGPVATAAFTPAADGTATRTLTAARVPATAVISVDARAGETRCKAMLDPVHVTQVSCP